jgi:uncharacterized protein (DUF3084 family)
MITELIHQIDALNADLEAAVQENRKLKENYARAIVEIDKLSHEKSRLHEQLQALLIRQGGHA